MLMNFNPNLKFKQLFIRSSLSALRTGDMPTKNGSASRKMSQQIRSAREMYFRALVNENYHAKALATATLRSIVERMERQGNGAEPPCKTAGAETIATTDNAMPGKPNGSTKGLATGSVQAAKEIPIAYSGGKVKFRTNGKPQQADILTKSGIYYVSFGANHILVLGKVGLRQPTKEEETKLA